MGWVDTGQPTQRWKPSERGGLTIAQDHENAAIDQARQTLDQLGMSCEGIIAASQEATATGRENRTSTRILQGWRDRQPSESTGPIPILETAITSSTSRRPTHRQKPERQVRQQPLSPQGRIRGIASRACSAVTARAANR